MNNKRNHDKCTGKAQHRRTIKSNMQAWRNHRGKIIAECGVHNAQRNLMKKLGLVVAVYTLKLVLDAGELGEQARVDVPCLNLYEIFAAMYAAGMLQFTAACLGEYGDEAPSMFWSAAKRSSVYAKHPCVNLPLEALAKVIPFLVFYDGSDVYRDKEFLWILASAVTTSKIDEWDSEFPLICVPAELVKTEATKQMFFRAITRWLKWNFLILRAGIGPTEGFYGETLTESMSKLAGKTIAGGYLGEYAGNTGDFKAKWEWQGYCRYYRCRLLCEACLAEQPTVHADRTVSSYDFNHNANFRATILTTQQIEELQDRSTPLSIMDGWDAEMYHRDPMHTGPLGQDKDSIASSVKSMLDLGLLGPKTGDDALAQLHVELDEYCKHNRVKLVCAPKLSLRTLGLGDSNATYPELSSQWKAAPTTVLLFFIAHKCEQVCKNSAYEKLIATHMWAAAEFKFVTKHSGLELLPTERARALHAGRVYLLTLQSLNKIAKDRGLFLWRTRPKNHAFDHILITMQTSPINPEVFSCMKRESMLGALKKIAKSCSRITVSKTVLEKWLCAQKCRINLRQRSQKFRITAATRKTWIKTSEASSIADTTRRFNEYLRARRITLCPYLYHIVNDASYYYHPIC